MISHPSNWIEEALASIAGARIAVFGDFCLDAYWLIDSAETEKSVETGLPVRRVRSQRYSPGGAGNVVANLLDMGVSAVRAIGAVGSDLFGSELLRLLRGRGADVTGMLALAEPWQTMVYAKPCVGEVEDRRLDFGAFNELPERAAEDLLAALTVAADSCDVVILNQQIPTGISSSAMIERINKIVASHPKTKFIVDSRHRAAEYHGAILKLNAQEATVVLDEKATGNSFVSTSQAKDFALRISKQTGKPVFLTRGEMGMLVADGGAVHICNGLQVLGQTDPVGAGDTVVATLAAVLGSGGDALAAARLANIAASVTVRKLQTTGTATPDEIREAGAEPNEIFSPELAADSRLARFLPGTDIELIEDLPNRIAIKHAIFDHDGTLSTLRQGWEQIMEPMMLRAILGDRFEGIDKPSFDRVREMCRDFIDQTTGIQTLVQMQGLAQLVRRAAYVPPEKVLDEHGYKAIYNRDLLEQVRQRVDKLIAKELEPADFQIKNAHAFLLALKQRGIKLHLASGTDEQDVIEEARAMGYADLFEGRIYGEVGDVKIEAKKVVLEQIIRDNALTDGEFVTFGDGPVEMRETRRRGGIAIGLPSDEVRRCGINPAKRGRLIRAGAAVLVPDFSQLSALLGLLRLS